MEERYEIRGKIGQGGLGAVYRGYDTRMNREVAIKRISVSNDDPTLQEESTRQLIKEAGALASLQHPHIVTVYDVGSDEDGPYVVMELISGKTLDELIERAPLTWNDFRELALQTQEALIAAQELDLIHSDIKPTNLMLTWLPSGKFQVKIVDFGLATLTQSQSREELEELEELEAVFGSIFFMAPEQFERVPIDARTDVYAMGCVYYQALAGTYPFNGETGHEVMTSHLHHKVTPLQEVRADIPLWVCDWIMWQLNRQPADRPESSRQALQVFLQNDKNPNPTMSLGRATAPKAGPPRSRPPGAGVPTAPTRKVAAPAGQVAQPVPTEMLVAEPPSIPTAPQPLLPPEGSKPSVHTGPNPIPDAVPTATAVPTSPVNKTGRAHASPVARGAKSKKPVSRIKVIVAVAMVAIIAVLGFMLSQQIKKSQASQRYNNILAQAAKADTTEIPMTGPELQQLLEIANNSSLDEKSQNAIKALALAKSTDGADFDSILTDFFTKAVDILPEDRAAMIRTVLGKRMNAAMVKPLMDFARETPDNGSAIAAFEVILPTASDSDFETILGVAQFPKTPEMRKAAEEVAISILKKSNKRPELMELVNKAFSSATNSLEKASLQRIKASK